MVQHVEEDTLVKRILACWHVLKVSHFHHTIQEQIEVPEFCTETNVILLEQKTNPDLLSSASLKNQSDYISKEFLKVEIKQNLGNILHERVHNSSKQRAIFRIKVFFAFLREPLLLYLFLCTSLCYWYNSHPSSCIPLHTCFLLEKGYREFRFQRPRRQSQETRGKQSCEPQSAC